jgi:hypothetical protein
LALAVYWALTFEKTGTPDAPAVVVELTKKINANGELGRPISFHEFYAMSAPETDLLGDADAFGLFSLVNTHSKLSKLLSAYYVGDNAGYKQRWHTFCGAPNNNIAFTIKAEDNTVVWADGYTQKWMPRLERVIDLLDDGALSAIKVLPTRRHWKYAFNMLLKFQVWLKDQLENEINTKHI